jgi:hypothetical protein
MKSVSVFFLVLLTGCAQLGAPNKENIQLAAEERLNNEALFTSLSRVAASSVNCFDVTNPMLTTIAERDACLSVAGPASIIAATALAVGVGNGQFVLKYPAAHARMQETSFTKLAGTLTFGVGAVAATMIADSIANTTGTRSESTTVNSESRTETNNYADNGSTVESTLTQETTTNVGGKQATDSARVQDGKIINEDVATEGGPVHNDDDVDNGDNSLF